MTYDDLPCACGKQDLFKHLKGIPEKELRNTINEIVSVNRNLPLKNAKLKKALRKNEVEQVMAYFGYIEEDISTLSVKPTLY